MKFIKTFRIQLIGILLLSYGLLSGMTGNALAGVTPIGEIDGIKWTTVWGDGVIAHKASSIEASGSLIADTQTNTLHASISGSFRELFGVNSDSPTLVAADYTFSLEGNNMPAGPFGEGTVWSGLADLTMHVHLLSIDGSTRDYDIHDRVHLALTNDPVALLTNGFRYTWTDAFSFPIVRNYDVTFNVTYFPRTLLGDVNNDGVVNYHDIGRFLRILLSGSYNDAADMNGDGKVNGLDVAAFVAAVNS